MPSMTVTSADGTLLAVRRTGRRFPVGAGARRARRSRHVRAHRRTARRATPVWVYSRRGRGGSGDGPRLRLRAGDRGRVSHRRRRGGDAHLVATPSVALCCLFAATRSAVVAVTRALRAAPAVRSLDPSVAADAESALDAGDPTGPRHLVPRPRHRRSGGAILRTCSRVGARLREGVRLCPREGRCAPRRAPSLIAHDPQTSRRCTCTDKRPTRRASLSSTRSPDSCPTPDSTASRTAPPRLRVRPGHVAETILAFTTTTTLRPRLPAPSSD